MSASRYRRRGIAPLRLRARAGLATAVIAVGVLLGGGSAFDRASAAPLQSCTPSHGTIVAVDFAHWGGPIVRGCGVDQKTGYALLHATGFTTAGDEHDGPAVICRLGDAAFRNGRQYPTPAQDNCVQTPPTTGYWAYWVAPEGTNHWAYALLGAMGEVPRPGEVELWIFGATDVAGTHGTAVPKFSPATLRPRPPVRPHTSSTTTTHTSTATTTTRTSTTQSSTTSTHTTITTATTHQAPTHKATAQSHPTTKPHPATHRTPHRHPKRPRRSAEITGTFTMSTTAAGGTKVVSARPTSGRASAGSATPLIIGAALLVLLCAGAGRAIWLRRREE